MTGSDDPPRGLSARFDFLLTDPVDFTSDDPTIIAANVRLLTAVAAYFNVLAVTEFGGRVAPARDARLVEQVVAAAFQRFGGEDPHPTPFAKAAMLLRGITQGHPFEDGNKRTGFLLAAYYLENVGFMPPDALSEVATVRLCLQISAGEIRDTDEIARQLTMLWGASPPQQ